MYPGIRRREKNDAVDVVLHEGFIPFRILLFYVIPFVLVLCNKAVAAAYRVFPGNGQIVEAFP